MPKRPALSRISITIPADLLEAADRLAVQFKRSRSWLMGEAVRRLAEQSQGPAASGVREPALSPYAAFQGEIEGVRRRRLEQDLTLTPEERLRRSEELVGLARLVRPARHRAQVIGFDSYDDYFRWKTRHRAGG